MEFDRLYPEPEELLIQADIADRSKTFERIIEHIGEPTNVLGNLKVGRNPVEDIRSNLQGAYDYETLLIDLLDRVYRMQLELPPIYQDIDARARVLLDIARNLEQAFIWIHTHGVGAILPVYYESFTLWSTKDVFQELGNQLSSFSGEIKGREASYRELGEKLDQKIMAAEVEIDPWRNSFSAK